jgi:hypothetical protein
VALVDVQDAVGVPVHDPLHRCLLPGGVHLVRLVGCLVLDQQYARHTCAAHRASACCSPGTNLVGACADQVRVVLDLGLDLLPYLPGVRACVSANIINIGIND